MASCQQYEEKRPFQQGQIVRVSCEAYSDRDMGVVVDKKVRLVRRNLSDPTQTWLKEEEEDNPNAFALLLPPTPNNQPYLTKGLGTDVEDPDEVALVDILKVVKWTESGDKGGWSYISRADANDSKVWTAEEAGCFGIRITLRPKQSGNRNQLWHIYQTK